MEIRVVIIYRSVITIKSYKHKLDRLKLEG